MSIIFSIDAIRASPHPNRLSAFICFYLLLQEYFPFENLKLRLLGSALIRDQPILFRNQAILSD